MIDPTLLSSALTQKSPSGHPAFTKSQIADIAIKEDSDIGKRIRRAMDFGVTKEQAIKYYAFGTSNGQIETNKPKQSFFSRFIQPAAEAIVDYGTAPGDVMAAGAMKAASHLPGFEKLQNDRRVKELPENLSQSADVARVAIPAAAGIATAGASIPATLAVSGAAGAGSSLLASGLEKAAGEEQTLGGAAGEALVTGATNVALDAATMGLFRLAKPAAKIAGLSDEAAKTTGKIIQGTEEEIKTGQKALQSIDTTNVDTYSDLHKVMENRISSLKTEQDALLDTMPGRYTADQLATEVKVGEKTAKDNFITSALNGLEELYQKTGNTKGVLTIQTLRETAEDPMRGLTVRQINDLAREYGRGFKAFSDSTGQPLTSVNAKMYETVRKGLKTVSRNLMPNEASKIIDEEMSNLIHTNELVKDMADKVQLLANKVSMRSLGDKVGSFIGKIVNLASLGTAGGFVKGITPSDVGLKTLNSLRIQQNLPKNLTKLNKLLEQIDTLPEDQIIARIKQIFTSSAAKAGVGAAINSANDDL